MATLNVYAHDSCTPVSSLPWVISQPGTYCLTKNLMNRTNLNAITIDASDVLLDLGTFRIESYNKKESNRSFGIFSLNTRNVTIKNGTIVGYMYGIYLSDSLGSDADVSSFSGGHLIENMTITGSFFRGIRIEGVANKVQNNTISGIGGCTVFPNALVIGIETVGPGAQIEHNVITEIHGTGTGESVALSFSNNSSGSSATSNIINNELLNQNIAQGNEFGIWVGGNQHYQSNVYLRENNISDVNCGIAFSSPTTGWYSNNTVNRVYPCDYVISSKTVSTTDSIGIVNCNLINHYQIEQMNKKLITGKPVIQ